VKLRSLDDVVTVLELEPYGFGEQAGLCVGDVVKSINGMEVDCATLGCALLRSAPAGYIEIVVSTSAPPGQFVLPKQMAPVKSAFDDEIELLPCPSKQAAFACAPSLTCDRELNAAYDRELGQLDDMGFHDLCAARCALRRHGGDVHAAATHLLELAERDAALVLHVV
jgi:hypothetical protein